MSTKKARTHQRSIKYGTLQNFRLHAVLEAWRMLHSHLRCRLCNIPRVFINRVEPGLWAITHSYYGWQAFFRIKFALLSINIRTSRYFVPVNNVEPRFQTILIYAMASDNFLNKTCICYWDLLGDHTTWPVVANEMLHNPCLGYLITLIISLEYLLCFNNTKTSKHTTV